jgi:glycine cleavage system regulatory protein
MLQRARAVKPALALATPSFARAAIPASLHSRRLSSQPKVPMPPGARAQFCVSVTGRHRANGLNDITSLLAERGASIVTAKRIKVAEHFAAMIAVWIPPARGIRTARALETEMVKGRAQEPRLKGFNVNVVDISKVDSATDSQNLQSALGLTTKRLKVLGPQQPGMLNSLTSVLLDHDCAISNFEADTSASVGDQVMFRLAADVLCPDVVEQIPPTASPLDNELQAWASEYDAFVEFDEKE